MAKARKQPQPDPLQEIEAKFAVKDPLALADLNRASILGPQFALGPAVSVQATDTYYDTPEFAFTRAGYALRIRTLAGQTEEPALVTLKSLESLPRAVPARPVHTRFEVEGPLSPAKNPAQITAWPGPVRKKAKEIVGPRPGLRPILLLTQERCKRALGLPAASETAALAELSLDTVTVRDPHGEEAPQVGSFWELEVELTSQAPGDQEAFGQAVAALATQPGLAPVGQSKPAQGLLLISAHPAGSADGSVGLRPEQSMAEAGRVVWRQELMKMILCEAGVREAVEIEYVHDMRVATRRARAALDMFGPYFQEKPLDEYARRLRKTAQFLGDVRDLDVALDNLERHIQSRAGRLPLEGSDALRERWEQERSSAQAELSRWLDNPKYRRFVADFTGFCTHAQVGALNFTSQPGVPPTPHQVRHVLPGAIWSRFQQVRAYESLFAQGDELLIPDETLHQLRIDVKALRYNLDFTQHLLSGEGQSLLKQLRQVQSHLGDLNDAVVKAARLESLRQEGLDSPFVEHYIEVQMEVADRLRRTFPSLWDRFNRPETRSRLARALARI